MRKNSHALDTGRAHAVTIGDHAELGAVPGTSNWEVPAYCHEQGRLRLVLVRNSNRFNS